MPFVTTPTGRLHYMDAGSGEPLILLHANPGDSRDFDAVVTALAENFRVLALDWPGYGLSDVPSPPASASIPLYLSVLVSFMDALAIPRASFIGNSVGGNVAARMAATAPDRLSRLVLVSPGGFTPHDALSRTFCRLQSSVVSIPPKVFARVYLKHRNTWTERMLERADALHSTPDCLSVNRALWRGFGSADSDLQGIAGRIKAPTLLIFGEHDPVIPAKKDGAVASRCIPAAKNIVLPCGHAAFAEVPEQFLPAVTDFLRTH
jgi:pimeloyl-ACP methyl ester carboxylesterase